MTAEEKQTVAALVESAYREACMYDSNIEEYRPLATKEWNESAAKAELDAMLAAPDTAIRDDAERDALLQRCGQIDGLKGRIAELNVQLDAEQRRRADLIAVWKKRMERYSNAGMDAFRNGVHSGIAWCRRDLEAAGKEGGEADNRLRDIIRRIAGHTNADDPKSYRCDDPEGCLDTVHGICAAEIASWQTAEAAGKEGGK